MKSTTVDIFILSGFLGSGKSTLLAKIIEYEQQQGRKIGIIMNEMGQVSIDSDFIPDETPFKELSNGCICCNLQGELSLQLKQLIEEYQLDAIYIESTGAAHLLDVIDACTHPTLLHGVKLKSIITVVNAKQWQEGKMSIKLKKLLMEQIKYADIIVLNKLDTIEKRDVDSLSNSIREINPDGQIIPTSYAEIDLSLLTSTMINSITVTNEDDNEHAHFHLKTFTFSIHHPISRIELENYLQICSGQLYRVKGFIKIKETPGIFLFNYAYGYPIFERCKPNKQYEPVLVFIGENLDGLEIESALLKLQND
ncbi:CobW family GTP-binding protein [Anaerobacillus sp. MEB173]|uniref:CobW family GTP-binding protein n=1 Tax=Anaerobacillus sp. MEB173 TaxID=3383345 RepID=UPI003F911281